MPINVYATSNTKSLSRSEVLSWVNSVLETSYKKVEELATGVAYCQLLNILFPDSIPLHKVNKKPLGEHNFRDNWKLIQTAFFNLSVDRDVPIEKLVRAKLLDNLEFAQWYVRFHEANSGEITNLSTHDSGANKTVTIEHSPDKTVVLGKTNSSLDESHNQLVTMARDLEISIRERQFYFEKLRKIELLLGKMDQTDPNVIVLTETLYEVEEGFFAPDEE